MKQAKTKYQVRLQKMVKLVKRNKLVPTIYSVNIHFVCYSIQFDVIKAKDDNTSYTKHKTITISDFLLINSLLLLYKKSNLIENIILRGKKTTIYCKHIIHIPIFFDCIAVLICICFGKN